MARKKKADATPAQKVTAEITLQPITETIEKNYMPYVMSVIVSRALPDIDGFKPSHRKLLYTMYKMGLLNGARTKSAALVSSTVTWPMPLLVIRRSSSLLSAKSYFRELTRMPWTWFRTMITRQPSRPYFPPRFLTF